MPRRSILSAAERENLLALPDSKDDLIRHYTFSDTDLSIIRQRRGPANRLGFAVQLCYLRFPGVILGVDEPPFPPLLKLVAEQIKVGVESWDEYGQREQTRREHLVELQTVFDFRPFTMSHYRQAVQMLTELAMQTDKGIVLASALIGHLRRQSVILPALNAVERASAEAITRANRRIYDALAEPLADCRGQVFSDSPIGDFCKFSDSQGIDARTEPVNGIPAWSAVGWRCRSPLCSQQCPPELHHGWHSRAARPAPS